MSLIKKQFKESAFPGSTNIFSKTSKIKPEHLVIGTWYSITISPDNSNKLEDFELASKYSLLFQTKLDGIFSADIRLWIEYSEDSRFHFHGIVKINNPIHWFCRDLPRLRSGHNVDIDTIVEMSEWLLYCQKMQYIYDGLFLRELATDYGLKIFYTNYSHKLRVRNNKIIL